MPRLPALALLAAALLLPHVLGAQVGTRSTATPVALTAAQPSFLSVTVLSGEVQTIPSLVAGALNPFPLPARIQTSWNLRTGSGTLSLVAWFGTPAQALVNGAAAIPAGRVQGRVLTGRPRAFTPITQGQRGGVGVVGGSLELWRYGVCNRVACRRRSRIDNLELRLNLAGLPLAAGTYSGTLNLRAVTY